MKDFGQTYQGGPGGQRAKALPGGLPPETTHRSKGPEAPSVRCTHVRRPLADFSLERSKGARACIRVYYAYLCDMCDLDQTGKMDFFTLYQKRPITAILLLYVKYSAVRRIALIPSVRESYVPNAYI